MAEKYTEERIETRNTAEILIFLAAFCGIASCIFELISTHFLFERVNYILHIGVWCCIVGMLIFMHYKESDRGQRAAELAMLFILVVMQAQPFSDVFRAAGLMFSPVAMMFLIIGVIALLTGRFDLLRACVLAAIAACLYGAFEFNADDCIGSEKNFVLYINEMFMMYTAFVYSYEAEYDVSNAEYEAGEKDCDTDFMPESILPDLRRMAAQVKMSTEITVPVRLLHVRLAAQTILTGIAAIAFCTADLFLDVWIPEMRLWLFMALTLVTIFQSAMCDFTFDNRLIALLMFFKLETDMHWDLVPAEGNYYIIIALLNALLVVAAAGGSRGMYALISMVSLVFASLTLVEYYCDPAAISFAASQVMIWAKFLMVIVTSLFAAGKWQEQEYIEGMKRRMKLHAEDGSLDKGGKRCTDQ